VQSLLLGAIVIGLVHGLEPGHGWPIAVVYSASRRRRWISAVTSSTIISFAHFVSSIAVVVAYVVFTAFVALPSEIMSLVAAGLLVILGIMFLREEAEDVEATQHGHFHPDLLGQVEHEHEHQHPDGSEPDHSHAHVHQEREILTLKKIAGVAFVLGFAHEEEFALLAFAMGGLNPWVMMTSYALAVTASLVAATLIGVKMFEVFESRVTRFQGYLPKISGAILLIMAAFFIAEALPSFI
jgi:ABC-type nickel/cobalt efflux system permease component RcnA